MVTSSSCCNGFDVIADCDDVTDDVTSSCPTPSVIGCKELLIIDLCCDLHVDDKTVKKKKKNFIDLFLSDLIGSLQAISLIN